MNNVFSKAINLTFALLTILSLVFVINKGVIMSPDSNAYFGMWPYVPAGYPFFLRGLHFLVSDYYGVAAVAIQFIAVVGSIYLFSIKFLKEFKLKNYQIIILLILLFYPIVDGNVLVVNNITTEGLSYAIFLQVIYVSYLAFYKRQVTSYIILSLLTVLLITIRGQFQYLFIAYFCIEILLSWKEQKVNWRKLVLIILIPFLVFAIDNVYHKLVQKQYFSTPFTFTALVTSVLFVSDKEDEQYLETEEEKQVFNLVLEKFKEKKIGYKDHKYFAEPIDWNYFFYHYELPTLCNQTVQQEVLRFYLNGKERSLKNKVNAYLYVEKVHKKIFFNLLPHKFLKWFALAFQNFKTGIGGISIVLLYLISFVLLLKRYFKRKEKEVLFAFFLVLLILLNHTVISISVHGLTRYFFYTHTLTLLLFFWVVNTILKEE